MFNALYQKIIISVLSLGTALFTNIAGVRPEFANGLIEQAGTRLVCSAELTNCWTPEFDQILRSGQIIIIHYRVELFAEGALLPQENKSFNHELRYNVLDETFTVRKIETGEVITSRNLDDAKAVLTHIKRFEFTESKNLKPATMYYLRVSAGLNHITLPGMPDEINLMNYWKNARPLYLSEPFSKTDFSS